MIQLERLEDRNTPGAVIVGNDIVVTGTAGNDAIYVNASDPGAVVCKVNNETTILALPAGGHIIVHALEGRDNITLLGNVSGELYGGDGQDTITGGSGHDVIWGGAGDDLLNGGNGNDVLIGGSGTDRLSGGTGKDVEIGGEIVAPAYDYAALRTVSDNWAASETTDPDIEDGTVVSDTELDRFTGGSEADWFAGNASDIYTDFLLGTDLKSTF